MRHLPAASLVTTTAGQLQYAGLVGLAANSDEAGSARDHRSVIELGQVAWLDFARLAAALSVVYLHVSAQFVSGSAFGSAAWWTGNVFDASVRWGVPVFVMISGALLLDSRRSEGASAFYRKRSKRLLIPLVFWTCVFLLWRYVLARHARTEFSWANAAKDAITGVPYFHLWFLFMMVGLYLFAPAIQAFVLNSTRRELWFFTCVMFVLAAVVRLERESPGPWPVWFLQYLAYFICGHLIATSAREASRALGLISYALSVTLTAVGCYVVARATDLESGLYFYSYLSVSVIPMSIAAMWLLKSISAEMPGVRQAATVSGLSLGIYLVHPMFLDIVFMHVRLTDYAPAVAVPILTALTFCVCALLCLLVQRVPLLRRTI